MGYKSCLNSHNILTQNKPQSITAIQFELMLYQILVTASFYFSNSFSGSFRLLWEIVLCFFYCYEAVKNPVILLITRTLLSIALQPPWMFSFGFKKTLTMSSLHILLKCWKHFSESADS